jgi:putative ABC transport system permease protein
MNIDIIRIGWMELGLAMVFVVVTGAISVAMSLGLVKNLLIATVRTYLQLFMLGFILMWIFSYNHPWVVFPVFFLMIGITAQMALSRVKTSLSGLYAATLTATFLSSFIVTTTVTALIIRVDPWYDARYFLTIGGMILGNTMNGMALSLERLFDDLRKRRAEVHQCLAFGATPWEAALPSIRTALSAGLIPTMNAMNAVGIVSIPGMMTGQLLAGADPVQAAKYQIVVMLMLSAATAISSMGGVYLAYTRAFDSEWRFMLE